MESSSEDKSDHVHPVFTRDPAELMQYVYKEVCVLTEDGATHTGRVYTVDPVSQSMALIRFTENQPSSLRILMGHAIQKITVLDHDMDSHKTSLDEIFKPHHMGQRLLSKEELGKRKDMVKSWLLKNRLPVQESPENSEVLSISDALYIEPPYDPESCRSTNEIILGRVQGLMKNMPADVDKW